MSFACNHHCDIVGIAVVDAFLVADASTRVNYSIDAGFVGNLHTIREWEERIGSHYSAIEVESERAGFCNGLLEGVDAGSLPYTACKEHTTFCKDDGV